MRCLEMLLEPVLYTRACADGNYGKPSGSKCKSGGHGSFWRRGKRGAPSNYTYQWYYSASLTGGEGDTRCKFAPLCNFVSPDGRWWLLLLYSK